MSGTLDTLDGLLANIVQRIGRVERRPVGYLPTVGLAAVQEASEVPTDAPVGAVYYVISTGAVMRMQAGGFTHLDPDGNVETYDHYTAGD